MLLSLIWKSTVARLVLWSTLPLVEIISISVTSLVGMFALSASLEGYLLHHMPWYERILSAVGGLLLIYPGIVTDLVGVCLVALVVVAQLITKKKYIAVK